MAQNLAGTVAPIVLLGCCLAPAVAVPGLAAEQPTSKTVAEVLRQPLPPEELRCSASDKQILISGPTFTYTVDRGTGAIQSLRVTREGRAVAELLEPADLRIDERSLALAGDPGTTEVVAQGPDKVVLSTKRVLRGRADGESDVRCELTHTFYNDGVVVVGVTLLPSRDLPVRRALQYRVKAAGEFSHYFHKRRDREGAELRPVALPDKGQPVGLATLTSCLQVFSPEAGLAVFTDRGGMFRSREALPLAVLEVQDRRGPSATVELGQYLVHVGSGDPPFVLRAGSPVTFRVGMSLAPNRSPHARRSDLRMFIWVGDAKYPYPTDAEIWDAARLGFTLFQMHRLGTPGEPRPPAAELDRVIKTVHAAGMLFLWTENADLKYASAARVRELRDQGKWSLWQGFNYGGRYTARMDPYCDLLATCLASPNGLAEYRLECIGSMMDKYAVDGMYIDDNLAYANCPLWKEHGHPSEVYDCLIELHHVNWARRQALRSKCPHAVLVDHCSYGLVLPVVCDFDVHLFGEGYSFPSAESYWHAFGAMKNMYAQGSLFAGDSETERCPAELAYAYDLLTGGGQYCYLDWRLYPKKFPHAAGVTPEEPRLVRAYNLAQCWFGMHESRPYYFATCADLFSTAEPNTYATVYRNQVWNDYLVPLVNLDRQPREVSLRIHRPEPLGLRAQARYVLVDVARRSITPWQAGGPQPGWTSAALPARSLRLYYLREAPPGALYHLWGGKRMREVWDPAARRLAVKLSGPAGVETPVIFGGAEIGVGEVRVDGQPAAFFLDPQTPIVHGKVTFRSEPIAVEVVCSAQGKTTLPRKEVAPDEPRP